MSKELLDPINKEINDKQNEILSIQLSEMNIMLFISLIVNETVRKTIGNINNNKHNAFRKIEKFIILE